MDASQQVAKYFDSLVERVNWDRSVRPNSLPKNDQIIFYLIMTRCEMDINGFNSVFEQLLTEKELVLLIDALNKFGANNLADSFSQALSRLQGAGFLFGNDSRMVSDLDSNEVGFLDDIEEAIRKNDSLWDLDDRLAELIPAKAK